MMEEIPTTVTVEGEGEGEGEGELLDEGVASASALAFSADGDHQQQQEQHEEEEDRDDKMIIDIVAVEEVEVEGGGGIEEGNMEIVSHGEGNAMELMPMEDARLSTSSISTSKRPLELDSKDEQQDVSNIKRAKRGGLGGEKILVGLSKADSAPQLIFTTNESGRMVIVQGKDGYRTVKANPSISKGEWMFEIKVNIFFSFLFIFNFVCCCCWLRGMD